MNATPAGWYDDPERPGQKRYWDGSAWAEATTPTADTPTEEPPSPASTPASTPTDPPAPMAPPASSAPTSPSPPADGTPPPPPVGGATLPPPAEPPAKTSRKGLWIVLSIVGVIVVLVILAVVAVAVFGSSATNTLEENLPEELETNYADQGLPVTISDADCDTVPTEDGPFTSSCTLTIEDSSRPLTVNVTGTISGSTLFLASVESSTNLINEALAVTAAQQVVDASEPGLGVTGCTLSDPIVVLQDGDTFSCEIDSGQTVTFVSNDNTIEVQSVS